MDAALSFKISMMSWQNWLEKIKGKPLILILFILLILAALPLFLPARRQPLGEGGPQPRALQEPTLEKPRLEEVRVPGASRPTVVTPPDTFAPGVAVKRLKVYEITSVFASLEKGKEWAKRFGFAKEPEKEDADSYLWLSDGYHMFRYDLKRNSFEYYFQPKAVTGSGTLQTLDDFEKKAADYLISAGLYKDKNSFEISRRQLLKRKGTEYSHVQTLEEAEEVLFSIRPLLNGLPVVVGEQEMSPTLIDLDKFGQVRQLVHHLQDFTLKEKGEYPLKSYAEAATEASEGKGTIVSVSGLGYEVPQLRTVSLSSAELAYLYPQGGDANIQPVYVFTGLADASYRRTATVKSVVPALAGY